MTSVKDICTHSVLLKTATGNYVCQYCDETLLLTLQESRHD